MGALLETIMPARRGWLLLPVAVLLAVVVLLRVDEMPVGAATDDAHYAEMARSLAEGRGAVLHVGPESVPEDTVFPPGLPLLLTPLAAAFPDSLAALKLVPLLAILLLLPLCLAWPDAAAAPRLKLALAAVVTLNPWIVAQAGRLLSDLPYTTLSLAAGAVFVGNCGRADARWWRWLAAGALAGAAVLVRSVGLTLVAAMALHLLLARRPGPLVLVVVAAALVVVLPALPGASPAVVPVDRAYGDQLLGHSEGPVSRLDFMRRNLVGYFDELPALVVPVFGKAVTGLRDGAAWQRTLVFVRTFVALAVLGLCALGWDLSRRRGAPGVRFWAFYTAFYGLALLNFSGYPSGVQLRLLIPLLPVVAWYLLLGADARNGRGRSLTLAAVLALVLGASLAHNAWRIARPLRQVTDAAGRGFVDPAVGAEWIAAHTAPDDVVAAQAPLERHIHLRRPMIATGTPDSDALAVRLSAHGVALVLVGPHANGLPRRLDEEGAALLAILRARPDRYPPVHRVPGEQVHLFGVADAQGRCRWTARPALPDR